MRMLVTGAGGMLGRAVSERATDRGWKVVAHPRAALDVGDRGAVRRAVADARPDVVVNAAGYTRVDAAESDPATAWRANADGAAAVAQACAEHGAALIHLSTDYVFDGRATTPYAPDAPTNPLGVYGASKLAGEQAVRAALERHVILRTSWVFAPRGHNFVLTMARLAREREELRIVADQTGAPTSAGDLAEAVLEAAARAARTERGGARGADQPGKAAPWGTHHFRNAGQTTWHGLACAVVDGLAGRAGVICRRVVPIATADYPTPAARPAYSVLDMTTWSERFALAPRPWEAALHDVLAEVP
ncbi:MAG TPA: dTDP-4-dehydrorhamnose reductase [Gemmatimonadales bacterium]|nr:dTDP-4-dehydrorhamnose reductase [Gemmatimonadales bacterium]